MKIFDFKNNINMNELEEINKTLKNGGLVIFPTETVYGIGADCLNKEAVNKIFQAKGRANDNPLIVHIANFKMLDKLVLEPNNMEKKLIDAFMPGPFTLILKKKNIIPDNVTCNLDTVGIRFPENEIARKIIEYTNIPLAAPSANISSRPSGTNILDIKDEFQEKVDIIIDGGESKIGLESTVVKVINNIPTILRPGKITKEDIIKISGICQLDDHIFKSPSDKEIIESPGMKYKHYAPKKEAILVYGTNTNNYIELINENLNDKTAILGFYEHKKFFPNHQFYTLGSINNLEEISHNIFKMLRYIDKTNCEKIIIEGVEKEGLGIAIMNRLLRSCSFNYKEK